MSYIINKTDGSRLTELVDGTIDQTSTDLTLVGKNATTYGSLFNENFVYLLENFANSTQPNHPITGQLWFDTTENRLKVYDGAGFKVSGGTIVAASLPSSIAQGDIWIDSYKKQLWFNDGSQNVLAGPIYTYQQGVSGFQTKDLLDTNNISRTVLILFVAQTPIGVFSSATFTPLNDSDISSAWSGEVKIGFTVFPNSSVRFNVPASQADNLIAADGTSKNAESFMQVSPTEGFTVSNGQIRVLNNNGIVLGASQNAELKIFNSALQISSNVINQNFAINSFNSSGVLPAIFNNAANQYIGVYTSAPTATLDVNGDVRIRGGLTVEGDITAINQTVINIEDIVINLGKTLSPSNSTANGGGILLEAGTDGDKTFEWTTVTNAWNSSENMNLAISKVYKIDNYEVLSKTQLGYTVTSAPGLNNIGQLEQLQVDNINLNGSTIRFLNPSLGDGTITLSAKGAGTIDVSSARITSVAAPASGTDATNKTYVDELVQRAPLGLSVNIGAYTETQLAVNILSKIYPPSEHIENTELRVWCIDTNVGKYYKLVSGAWTFQSDL